MKSGQQNLGMWIAIGAGIGTALGAATDNMGMWLALGVSMGLIFGTFMGRRKDEDKEE